MKINDMGILKDALHNCSTECTGNETFDGINGLRPTQVYGQGIVNGMVAAIMAMQSELDFVAALAIVKRHMPVTFDTNCMPKSWR